MRFIATAADLNHAAFWGADLTGARFLRGGPVPNGWVQDNGSLRVRRANADDDASDSSLGPG